MLRAMWKPIAASLLLALLAWSGPARAAEADLYCQTGTPPQAGGWRPASATNPCPVSASVTATTAATASATPTPVLAGTDKPFNIDLFSELFVQLSFAGTIASTNNGTVDAATQRVTLASDSTGKVAISQTTSGTTNGVASVAYTAGGWTQKWFVAANSDNATALKASAGVVHAIEVFGIGAAPAWLKFYDKATAPTCASDTIVKQIMIPAASTAANGSGAIAVVLDAQFATGISYCVVTGIAANDDTSPAAATFVVNIDWK